MAGGVPALPAYPGTTGGGGGGGGGGGNTGSDGGGSASNTAAGRKKDMLAQYKQYYKIVLGIKPNMRVINFALSGAGYGRGPLGITMFEKLVMLRDKNYRTTHQYKESAEGFRQTFEQMFGQRKPSQKLIDRAARKGMGTNAFYKEITGMRFFRQNNPDFGKTKKSLLDYMTIRNATDTTYSKVMGRAADRGELRQRFAADVSDSEFETNLQEYVGKVGAYDWATGSQLGTKDRNALLYNGDFQASVRAKLNTAVAAKQGYFGAQGARTDVSRDQLGRVTQNI